MATTANKTIATLIAAGTSVPAAGARGGYALVPNDLGGTVLAEIKNGATGPSTQAQAQVYWSADAGAAITNVTNVSTTVTVTTANTPNAVGDVVVVDGVAGISNVNGAFKCAAISAGVSFQYTAASAPSGTYTGSTGTAYQKFYAAGGFASPGTANNAVGNWGFPVDPTASIVAVIVDGNATQAVTARADLARVTGTN